MSSKGISPENLFYYDRAVLKGGEYVGDHRAARLKAEGKRFDAVIFEEPILGGSREQPPKPLDLEAEKRRLLPSHSVAAPESDEEATESEQSQAPEALPTADDGGRTYCLIAPVSRSAAPKRRPPEEWDCEAPSPSRPFDGFYSQSHSHDRSRPLSKKDEPVGRRAYIEPSREAASTGRAALPLVRLVVGLIAAAAVAAAPLYIESDRLLPFLKRLGAASASIRLESGNPSGVGVIDGVTVEPEVTTTTATTTTATTTAAATTTTAAAQEGTLPVLEQSLADGGASAAGVRIKNSTGYNPDFAALLKSKPRCKIKLNAGYQVLIIHTHTTETYAEREDGVYRADYNARTADKSHNVVAVGNVIEQRLEAAGVRTLHVTTAHDYPQYNGSYERAAETISDCLAKYPSIEMVIDVHRDAITRDNGAKIKPTAVIDGKKAAQIMIISGCDAGGKLYFSDWEDNLKMALRLQSAADDKYDGLMRPLYFAPYRYNMQMTPNSLLLEFGSDVNTLEEAIYSAELFGEVLAETLLSCKV